MPSRKAAVKSNKNLTYLIAATIAVIAAVAVLWTTRQATAAAPDSEYVYSFIGQSAGDRTVTNTAADNGGVDMILGASNWAPGVNGIDFNGVPNKTGTSDDSTGVGYANPAGSSPLTMTAAGSLGIAARFTYQRPPAGTCGANVTGSVSGITSNIAQIGRAGSGVSQIKLQITECTNGKLTTTPRVSCRAAGQKASTAKGQLMTNDNVTLKAGVTYVARCVKGQDSGTTAPITLLVQPDGQPAVPADTVYVPATGAFSSNQYVSVGNKYAGPEFGDQFFGEVSVMAICQTLAASQVTACLDSEVPLLVQL
ncbi:MAG TPA: hypothetical protein PK096_03005 [Candidatus Saccharibacteria bacterium]|nr:hypothetical protein [Candidatus Saccharibacteria bacterium]HRK94310.1 hypothetical protein [Candidatus Saccharibacteria bacterium]